MKSSYILNYNYTSIFIKKLCRNRRYNLENTISPSLLSIKKLGYVKKNRVQYYLDNIMIAFVMVLFLSLFNEAKADVISSLATDPIGKIIIQNRQFDTEAILAEKIEIHVKRAVKFYNFDSLKSNINFVCHQITKYTASCVQIFYERNAAANYSEASHVTLYIFQIFYRTEKNRNHTLIGTRLDSRSDIK